MHTTPKAHHASWWIVGRDNPNNEPAVAVDIHDENGTLISKETWTATLKPAKLPTVAAQKIARYYAKKFGIPASRVHFDPDSTETFAKD